MAASFLADFVKSRGYVLQGGGFIRSTTDAPSGPLEEEAVAPLEPISAAQLATMLGFGNESMWKHGHTLNEAAAPFYPFVGNAPYTTVTGTPTVNVAGPVDLFDRGIRFSDAQAASVDTANGILNVGANNWALMFEVRFNGIPAANRPIYGHNNTEDTLVQYLTSGNLQGVVVDSVAGTITVPLAISHNDGGSHTVIFVGINGANALLGSDLGVSSPISIAAVASLALAGSLRIGQNNNCPPADIYFTAYAYGVDSAENSAILNLYNNLAAAITNYRTATGR